MKVNSLIVGAGISGLTVASELDSHSDDLHVLESQERIGGRILTIQDGPELCEMGPNSLMVRRKSTEDFLGKHGLLERALWPNANSRVRYLERGNGLERISVGALLTRFLGLREFSRVVRGGRRGQASPDDTLADFVLRRFGPNTLRYLAEPFVSGIYASNPGMLQLKTAFPKIAQADQYPNLLWGLRQGRDVPPVGLKGLITFPTGLQELPVRLAEPLQQKISLQTELKAVCKNQKGFAVTTSQGEIQCRNLILCIAPQVLSRVLPEEMNPAIFSRLTAPKLAVHHFVVAASAVGESRRGFGFLSVDPKERNVLGCLMPSSMFAQRTSSSNLLLTAFCGGLSRPDLMERTLEDQRGVVFEELRRVLKIRAEPILHRAYLWENAIEQYDSNQVQASDWAGSLMERFPGLYFCHSFTKGVALPDRIDAGLEIASRIRS